jgi:hypothetical protein
MADTALPFALGAGVAALLAAGVYAMRGVAAAEPHETTQWTNERQREFAEQLYNRNQEVTPQTQRREDIATVPLTFGFPAAPTPRCQTEPTERFNDVFDRLENLRRPSIPVAEGSFMKEVRSRKKNVQDALSTSTDLEQRAAEDIATLQAKADDIKRSPYKNNKCQKMYELYIQMSKRYPVKEPYDSIYYRGEVPRDVQVHKATLTRLNEIFESIEKSCGWR